MARPYRRHRNTTKLVRRNLAPNMTAETLNSMLEGHGDVRSVKVMTGVMTGRCSGITYVTVDELLPGSMRATLHGSFLRRSHHPGQHRIQAGTADLECPKQAD
jgi:hypothetical protein